MYKLFYALKSASMGTRVMLEEIGAPYELIQTTVDMAKPRPPEQLAINPNGWVPVLVWDDCAMYECAAITVFLCDRHPEANLAPAVDDPARALYLQTLVYFSNSVQNAFQLSYYPDRFADTPTGIALDVDSRSIVQTAAVIADRPLEPDITALGQSNAKVVARQRVGHDNGLASFGRFLDFFVNFTDRPFANFDGNLTHAAASRLPTPQMPCSDGPSWLMMLTPS